MEALTLSQRLFLGHLAGRWPRCSAVLAVSCSVASGKLVPKDSSLKTSLGPSRAWTVPGHKHTYIPNPRVGMSWEGVGGA